MYQMKDQEEHEEIGSFNLREEAERAGVIQYGVGKAGVGGGLINGRKIKHRKFHFEIENPLL